MTLPSAPEPAPSPSRGAVLRPPDGVALSCSGVVDQMAFTNNNGIPLAAMVDFVPPASLQLPQVMRQPERCKACAAYMNVYCKTNLSKGIWKCSFCGQANMQSDYLAQAQGNCPELLQEAVEFVYPAPTASPPPSKAPHVVLLVDATADEPMLQNLRSAILEWLPTLDPFTFISLVSFDTSVSLHHLASPDPSSSDPTPRLFSLTLPGSRPLDPALLASHLCGPQAGSHLCGGSLGPGGQAAQLSVQLGAGGLEAVRLALASIRPMEVDLPLAHRPRCSCLALEAALRLLAHSNGDAAATTPLPSPSAPPDERPPPRLPRGSRVMLFAAGACTRGPGGVSVAGLEAGAGFSPKAPGLTKEEQQQAAAADRYAVQLGEFAAARGAVIDVVLGSSHLVHAPMLTTLARDTRGLVLLHRGFGPCLAASLKSSLSRCFGTSAVLDCYVSDGLRLAQWLGPVEALQAPDPEDVGLAMAQDRRLSSAACSVARLQEGQGAALRLEVVRNLEPPAVLVQVVLQFVDPSIGGRLVQRVITRRLPVVSSLSDYLRGVNAEVAAAVLAKKAVLDARRQGTIWSPAKAEELRYALRAQLSLIASRCGPEVQLSGGLLGFGARKARRLPPELLPLARTLYQLQRPCGPLLGPAFATPAALGLTYDQPGAIQAAGRGSSHATGAGAGAVSGDGSSNATGAAGAANTSSAAGGGGGGSGGGGFPAASSAPMDERLLRMGALLAGGLRASLLMVQPRLYLWQGSQPQGGFGQGQQGQGAVLLELPASDLAALAAVQGQLLAPGTQGQSQGAPGQGQGAAFVVVHAGHSVLAAPVPGVGTAAAPAAQGQGQVAGGSVPGAADVEALQAQVLALGATAWPAPELLLLPCIDPPTSTSPQPPASQPSGQKAGKGSAQVAGSAWALVQGHLLPLAGSKVGEVQALHPDLLPMHAQGQGSGSAGASGDLSFAEWCQAGGVQVTAQWL